MQHRQGRELWDENLDDTAICEYLHVPWVTDEEHARLCRTVGVAYHPKKRS